MTINDVLHHKPAVNFLYQLLEEITELGYGIYPLLELKLCDCKCIYFIYEDKYIYNLPMVH